jgi:hypothetical protein
MTDRELMQQALEMISQLKPDNWHDRERQGQVWDALRERLAQLEQKPYAWTYQNAYIDSWYLTWEKQTGGRNWTPLYTAPPKPDLLNQTCCECERSGGYALYCVDCWSKASEWQGLTDAEIQELRQQSWQEMWVYTAFARAIEGRLKEKNHV